MLTVDYAVLTNEDWRATLVLADAGDLTGATIAMQVKPSADHPDAMFDLSSAVGGGLTLNAGARSIAWAIAQTEMAEAPPGSFVFDVVATYASGAVKREAAGTLTITRGVTTLPRGALINVLGDEAGLEA